MHSQNRHDCYATGLDEGEIFHSPYHWLNCWHSAWVGKSGSGKLGHLFSTFSVIISFFTIGKTTDVIGKIIRRDLPYYDFYSHFWIFSDQALSNEKNNPWGLLKIAIKRGILDGSKFTFFGELSKDNINKIKRSAKTDRPALMIVDDKAKELGKAPFSPH